mmetsp:Transcript_29656/g.58215  ORF Transcript_29656/g.58215 Transcript_29656/m.58215 type:complete len:127 (-) Transcript_29656:324-704(-)
MQRQKTDPFIHSFNYRAPDALIGSKQNCSLEFALIHLCMDTMTRKEETIDETLIFLPSSLSITLSLPHSSSTTSFVRQLACMPHRSVGLSCFVLSNRLEQLWFILRVSAFSNQDATQKDSGGEAGE